MPDKFEPSCGDVADQRLRKRQLRLKSLRQEIERHYATNESINTLLSVVKYLNSVQDGDGLRIDNTYSRTDIDKPSRILNCHEEDIMNVSLIAMKRLITSLIPAGSQHSPVKTPVDSATSTHDS